ncbi:MAG: ACT domain-containing protein [Egibacteraceae bacterium]
MGTSETRPTVRRLELALLAERYAIARLPANDPVPGWARRGALTSITLTQDELSIVCREADVPAEVHQEPGWRAFKVAGPMDLELTGILSSLAGPLAEAEIGIFAVSTFDTDYLLVKDDRVAEAADVLGGAGHHVDMGNGA